MTKYLLTDEEMYKVLKDNGIRILAGVSFNEFKMIAKAQLQKLIDRGDVYRLNEKVTCAWCNGTGKSVYKPFVKCCTCDGLKYIKKLIPLSEYED